MIWGKGKKGKATIDRNFCFQRTGLNSERIKIQISMLTSKIELKLAKIQETSSKSQELDPCPNLDKIPPVKI